MTPDLPAIFPFNQEVRRLVKKTRFFNNQQLRGCLFDGFFKRKESGPHIQGSYNTPRYRTQAIKLANYERIPFTACWDRVRGVFQRCVETTLDHSVLLTVLVESQKKTSASTFKVHPDTLED